ncbi:excinuclease ABC subunit UvrC [Candidatus Thiosymbion oneisti]|uniref:excinuclease ABC subunit UvrC n=1 Tax=Candidatus Thiosymbion oneisti TaxID=589554 RepID=UPI000AAF3A61|nr:excinuclease ABC subunit UvrC [Candidatus Thiosymbion oneisti]
MAISDPRGSLKQIPPRPGVYRMLDESGTVLYVGKAKDLKRRVASYFSRALNRRLQAVVAQVADIEFTVTRTEGEALLLESNLIKSLQPRYNVLLRDDKSYPYIRLTVRDGFPRLAFYRGPRKGGDRFFGPYPSAWAVRETMQLLQKLFPVRQCEDSFFRNRSRPCLQYQIKRCSGPCVGLVTAEDYADDVDHTIKFLEGRTDEVVEELAERMEQVSESLAFERAAVLRDQIATLRRIQQRQFVSGKGGDLDLVACVQEGGLACVQVFFIRSGRNLGNKTFFPKTPEGVERSAVIAAFLAQFYADKEIPPQILVSPDPEDKDLLESAFSERSGRRVALKARVRSERARWLEMARGNATLALRSRLGSQAGYTQRLEALREALALEELPERMECFDVSHTGGERAVASCVVFDREGPCKSHYRRFNIEGVTPGDDYAAMHQALIRRYTRIKQGEYPRPDLLFIDGGRGQLGTVQEALRELAVSGVTLVGVAKGPDRRPGTEQLWPAGRSTALILPADSPAMHLVLQIRDEAHRFAVIGHRRRRAKARTRSVLEEIPGLGPKRRQRLLRQLGGLQGLARAAVEDIARIEGISHALAQRIYGAFHQSRPDT